MAAELRVGAAPRGARTQPPRTGRHDLRRRRPGERGSVTRACPRVCSTLLGDNLAHLAGGGPQVLGPAPAAVTAALGGSGGLPADVERASPLSTPSRRRDGRPGAGPVPTTRATAQPPRHGRRQRLVRLHVFARAPVSQGSSLCVVDAAAGAGHDQGRGVGRDDLRRVSSGAW